MMPAFEQAYEDITLEELREPLEYRS